MEGGALAPLLFFMAKTVPLIECFEDALMGYGYSYDDVLELHASLADINEIEFELKNGYLLTTLVSEILRGDDIRFKDESFDVTNYLQNHRSSVEHIAAFINEIMEIDFGTAERWAIQAIRHVVSPKYWRDCTIQPHVLHYIMLGSQHIPADVIAAAWSEAHQEHNKNVDDLWDRLRNVN